MIGEFGHISIIVALVTALLAAIAYWQSEYSSSDKSEHWFRMARWAYVIHIAAVVLAVGFLFVLIASHQFQYHYVWKHSSTELPIYYMISCFWEGQEGSFLIWIFWNALVGFILIRTSGSWEPMVMLVVSLIQVMLTSMILGVFIFGEIKVGSSPFMLLSEVIRDPIYSIDPQFVPSDGTGLNPLLQNIWMVIHPPVIFLGFSLAMVPFAFCVAGLIKNDLIGWIPKGQIWLGVSVGILGLGIMMGAYWAYETLNFGGYWNWDPVENAILIPWLVMLGALHGLILFQKRRQGLFFSSVLVLLGFVLVVYSTFLTRSGILGDSSVHSFTDLGLSGQLLVFLFFMLFVGVIGIAIRWRQFLVSPESDNTYGFAFWMQLGIIVMCLSAFQVLIPTSIPVFNAILESLGFTGSMAPPEDPVVFYSKFQVWFAMGFGIVMALGQMFYWGKIKSLHDLEEQLGIPLLITLIAASIITLMTKIHDWKYIVLVTSIVFGLSVCVRIFILNYRSSLKGGPLAHAGFSIMVLGFVFSAGHSRLISRNISINAPDSSLPIHSVQEHTLLNRNQPKYMNGYEVTYLGTKVPIKEADVLVQSDLLMATNYPDIKVLKEDLSRGQISYKRGDTVKIDLVNSYYDIMVRDGSKVLRLNPRMQNNPNMGYVASPAIHSFFSRDLYLHVSNFPDPEKQKWSAFDHLKISSQDTVDYKGLKIHLKGKYETEEVSGVKLMNDDLAVTFDLVIEDNDIAYLSQPIYIISEDGIRLYPDENRALGLRLLVDRIDPETGELGLAISHSQRDWITVKAKEMPMISLVWIGTLIMVFGVGVAVVQKIRSPRAQPVQFMKVIYRNEQVGTLPDSGELIKQKA